MVKISMSMEMQEQLTALKRQNLEKQQQLEAYQIRLNCSQRAAEAAKQAEAAAREQVLSLQKKLKAAEIKVAGYRRQLVQMQENPEKNTCWASLLEVEKGSDDTLFADELEAENKKLLLELKQAKQYGEEMAARAAALEKILPVRVYQKLRRK